MELKKIPTNLVILIVAVLFFIVLVNLNVISFFGGGKEDPDVVIQEYVTNKKLDSLINVIIDNQNAIEDYNKQIKNYQVSLEKIDKKIKSNQKELGEIAKEYEKNVSNINNYDSSEIYRYFAERYE